MRPSIRARGLQDALGRQHGSLKSCSSRRFSSCPERFHVCIRSASRLQMVCEQDSPGLPAECEALGTTGQIVWHFRNCEQLTLNPNSASAPGGSKEARSNRISRRGAREVHRTGRTYTEFQSQLTAELTPNLAYLLLSAWTPSQFAYFAGFVPRIAK